ncbi:putative polyamine transporter [Ophiobolus disseminans]|uniref:Polyamine transporter n=1 Tax=Ophiobolus disseminans TaxID=1469910 RepID=A0A6A7A3I1_9PLEO|nr:putative polyamine transporter [Ophiobolus disseminans]
MDANHADQMSSAIDEAGLRRTASNHVEWKKDHEQYPRNWSSRRKFYDTGIIVFLEFYTTVISTTGPSAATVAKEEYHLSRVVALVAFTFMYQLGQSIGGLLMPPFSESFGRRKPYIYSCAAFSIGCLITGVVPSVAGVFVGRFISGFASSVPSVVLAGSIQDLYAGTHRVWMIMVWNSLTTLGLVVGPIYGSYIAHVLGWRWIYYTSAIVTAVTSLLLTAIRESRPTRLLSQKLGRLEEKYNKHLEPRDNPDAVPSGRALVEIVLLRPARLAVTEPIIILVSLLSATAWGLVYLFTESLTVVYSLYGWRETTTSLAFIAIGLGIPISILPRLWDVHVLSQKKRRNQQVKPEDKIHGFVIAAPVLAIGLWLFSWTIPPRVHTHWAVSMVGLVMIGFAANEFAYTLNGYLADSYTMYASSGLAVLASLRALVSGLMPLFAYPMFSGLGGNVAGSILAAVATLFCLTPIVFLRYGQSLRERSQFAKYSAEVNQQHGDA